MRWPAAVLILAACSTEHSDDDVVGPFRGTVHRYVVDRFDVPHRFDDLADDLDGDETVENAVGGLVARLPARDRNAHVTDMINSGILASFVEIESNGLEDASPVGVRYFGHEGAEAVAAGGTFEAGSFRSNRTRTTRHPGSAIVRVPVFADADPVEIELIGMQIDLVPDGAGGFDAFLAGGIDPDVAIAATGVGIGQMTSTRPTQHTWAARLVDLNHDGVVESSEYARSLIAVFAGQVDIMLFGGKFGRFEAVPPESGRGWSPDSLSAGFHVHLAPCDSGNCALRTQASCHDRVFGGNETDLDCGGSCEPCEGTSRCTVPADCQTRACDAGRCRAPTCADGIRDGLESDTDCGGACSACKSGAYCLFPVDCQSGTCSATNRCVP